MIRLINRAKWLLSGNILFAFSQWLMLIFFSRMSSAEQLGYYSYALAITAPIFLLTNLQLRPLLVADFNTENVFKFSQYFSLRLITTIIASLISLFFVNWNNKVALLIFILVIATKGLESISDIIYAFYNAKKQTHFISKSLSIKSILIIIISFVTLYLTNNIFYSLTGTVIAYIFILIFIDIRQNNRLLKNIKFVDSHLRNIILTGLPLGISVMLISLQTNIPRYFLESYLSVKFVGIYTVFYYFLIIGGIIINSICQYLSPYFSEFYRNNELEKLKKSIFQASAFALLLGFLGLIVSILLHSFIIETIYGNDFVKYSYLLPYVMFAGIFSYLSVVSGYLLTSLKLFKVQMPIFLALVLFTTIYSYILIPKFGLLGAAYTTILTAVSQFIISSLVVLIKIKGLKRNV